MFVMALMNTFIMFRHHCKENNKCPPKHYAILEALMEKLVAVDPREEYTTIVRRERQERTAASPALEGGPPSSAAGAACDFGGHRLDENPTTVDNEQGLKKRQRFCKVYAL
ncbi:hypothetical protein PInf_004437 [Phytophthora infestans]|nr:hypothetical protein PInf_004437 [Phytophthora infestans]